MEKLLEMCPIDGERERERGGGGGGGGVGRKRNLALVLDRHLEAKWRH
jgi:hypothetical protein